MQVGGSPLNPGAQLCVPAASATTTYMNNGNFRVKNNTPHFLRLSYGPEAVSLTRREELNNGRMAMIAISGICAAELATGKDSDSLTTEGLSQLGVQRMAHLLSQEDQGLAFACRFSVRIPKFPQQLARKLKPISSHIFSHKSRTLKMTSWGHKVAILLYVQKARGERIGPTVRRSSRAGPPVPWTPVCVRRK